MARTHSQQLANHTLAQAVFANPLAISSAVAKGDTSAALVPLWEQAGQELAPIARVSGGVTFGGTLIRWGLYSIIVLQPPAPRETGDAAAIVFIGRGDGVSKLATISYYVIELELDRVTGAPSYSIVTRTPDGKGVNGGGAPLPDPQWIADHAFQLYNGRTPAVRTEGLPELPFWHWWHALDGASAIRTFNEAREERDRFEAVRRVPLLLLPEIAQSAEAMGHADAAKRLRELRSYFRRDTSLAPAWQSLIQRLANTSIGSAVANTTRAIPLIAEAVQYGAFSKAEGYEIEAAVRSRLAQLGVDVETNYSLAQELHAAAVEAARRPRMARGSAAPPINAEDPVWKPLFLDASDLPSTATPAERDETFSTAEPTFVAHGGLRAGYAAWHNDDYSAMARIIDQRWVFRTAAAAHYFLHAVLPTLADGLPALQAPQLGDSARAFGGEVMTATGPRRSHVLVVRIGRVVARLQVTEGAYAAAAREVLHAAALHPLAHKIVQRARQGLAAYWLSVIYPTNAVPALVHSPGHDAARLLQKYPYLGLSELPAALAVLGDQYAPVARSLASFQAQVRAHRWSTYRESMLALVRNLLTTDMGDPRVNAAHAHEIVCEVGQLDSDPIWAQLDAECRMRA